MMGYGSECCEAGKTSEYLAYWLPDESIEQKGHWVIIGQHGDMEKISFCPFCGVKL